MTQDYVKRVYTEEEILKSTETIIFKFHCKKGYDPTKMEI
jgi:hypothetical protein